MQGSDNGYDGRNSLWLGSQDFVVTAVDISSVAMAWLARTAAAHGLAVTTRTADLDTPDALAGLGSFDALAVIRFKLARAQWPTLLETLRPGGCLLLCSFGIEQHRRYGFPIELCLQVEWLRLPDNHFDDACHPTLMFRATPPDLGVGRLQRCLILSPPRQA